MSPRKALRAASPPAATAERGEAPRVDTTPPLATIEKRKPLTRRQVLELCLRQEGRCGCGCGVKLDPMGEGVIDEHLIALALTGPNELRNRSLWRKPCAIRKTKGDVKAIAKAKRIEARLTGTRRPRKPIPSRGFDKSKTRGFDGKVRPRTPTRTQEQHRD